MLTGDEDRWVARDLATGRELATGARRNEYTGMLDDVLVRSTFEGAVTATDVRTGERLWSRPAGDGIPARGAGGVMAMPGGRILLSADGNPPRGTRLGDALRVLDPRTGEVTEQPIDVDFSSVQVAAPDRITPRLPAVRWSELDGNDVSSRIIDGDVVLDRAGVRLLYVTPELLGFEGDGRTWGTGHERVIEIFDRDSGERRVRFTGEDTSLRTVGDALVIVDGDNVQRVSAPR